MKEKLVVGLFAGTQWDLPPHCERCGELESVCKCSPLPAPVAPRTLPGEQTARLAIEKRKKGKSVTVISGLSAKGNDLPELLTRLKTACGAGGSMQGETLEIQGEHLERVRSLLVAIGYKTKG